MIQPDALEAIGRLLEVGLVAGRVQVRERRVVQIALVKADRLVGPGVGRAEVAFLRFLSWNSADMNAADGRGGRSALHFAVGARHMGAVQCLLEHRPQGCGADPNQVDWYGRTPYQLALANGAPEIAAYIARTVTGVDTTPFVEDEDISDEEEWGAGKAPALVNSSA